MIVGWDLATARYGVFSSMILLLDGLQGNVLFTCGRIWMSLPE
jgi:hypothetical protein